MAARALLLAVAAHAAAAGSIADVKHIVIWMQENRAFDHYYGVLRGVRGYNDRTALVLPNGAPVWYQPLSTSNASDYQLPWHVDTTETSGICMDAPTMNYPTDIGMWNDGRMNAWNTARAAGMGMGHFNRSDLPYYYQAADSWTIGDAYHQATFTQTNPNRLHLFSGSNGLAAGSLPVLDNTEPVPGFTWQTVAETLQAAGVSWKVYQQPDNFDDNGFAWFKSFQDAQPGSPLYQKGIATVPDVVAAFKADVLADSLPQVSWIVGPTNLSEHASYHPSAGEDLSARLIAALGSNPAVYAKTVFVLNYDEGGQFFDHVWTPTPPRDSSDGLSTVTTQGELFAGLPMGLGFRVPLMLISPWSRGGWVNSQIFDHTSTIKLIETVFNVSHPGISPWRRTVVGDLLSTLDFSSPDYSWPTDLPDTSGYPAESIRECSTLPPPSPPAVQAMPVQEPGTRPSRALPYTFLVNDTLALGGASAGTAPTLALAINVTGTAGAPFLLYDLLNGTLHAPRKYAIEAGKGAVDSVPLPAGAGAPFSFALQGPNGFVRVLTGAATPACASLGAFVSYNVATTSVVLTFVNSGAQAVTYTVTDNAYGLGGPWSVPVAAGGVAQQAWNVNASAQWYDFTVAPAAGSASGCSTFLRRFMGRMETGRHTTSDPAAAQPTASNAGLFLSAHAPGGPFVPPAEHPLVPDSVRFWERNAKHAEHKDAVYTYEVPWQM